MRFLVAFVVASMAFGWNIAFAQPRLPLLGAGGKPSTASYVGPGDVKSGAIAWFGLRSYSAAYAAPGTNKAIRIRRASDNTLSDIVILANGNMDTASAVTFCAATSCFVRIWYDQSGNGFDATQTTNGSQPGLTFNCINTSLPCVNFPNGPFIPIANVTTYAQPHSWSFVGERTAGFTSVEVVMWCSGQSFIYFPSTANNIGINAGTQQSAAATDNVWHAAEGVVNGASSLLHIDATLTTGINSGAATCTGAGMQIGASSGAVPLQGNLTEVAMWNLAFSNTEASNIAANQRAYWGF